MEYYSDMKAFYERGGATPINYEMSAALLQDVVATMEQFINGSSKVAGAYRFAHAETVLPLETLLGYGDRTRLTAKFSKKDIDSRGFQGAALSPFAANVQFRLYTSGSKASPKYYVQVLVNEQDDVKLPGCGHVRCEWAKVRKLWRHYLEDIHLEEACRV